jgi:hypothetical protein
MEHESMKEIQSPEEIPQFANETEEAEFWATHSLGEQFLSKMEPLPEDVLPPARPRTKPISLRLDDDVLERVRALAEVKHKGYQTLMKEFVVERLYEEEKREGILQADQSEEESTAPPESAEKSNPLKTRDWQDEAYKLAKEYEEVLEDDDIDSITSSRVIDDAADLLKELSNEIVSASSKKYYPPKKLRRMMKGFKRLEEFCKKAFKLHEERFGGLEESLEDQRREVEEVEAKVIPLRRNVG